jgi:hypothetical protein
MVISRRILSKQFLSKMAFATLVISTLLGALALRAGENQENSVQENTQQEQSAPADMPTDTTVDPLDELGLAQAKLKQADDTLIALLRAFDKSLDKHRDDLARLDRAKRCSKEKEAMFLGLSLVSAITTIVVTGDAITCGYLADREKKHVGFLTGLRALAGTCTAQAASLLLLSQTDCLRSPENKKKAYKAGAILGSIGVGGLLALNKIQANTVANPQWQALGQLYAYCK